MVRGLTRLGAPLALASAVVMSGCAPVGPNYARPPVLTPPEYRFVDTPQQAASLADLPWWQVFSDPTLQILVREAIANNLDLQAAVARLQRARAEYGIAKSFLYPQVDATASYTAQQNFGGGGNDDDEDGEHRNNGNTNNGNDNNNDNNTNDTGGFQQGGVYGFQLSWEIDVFGRIRREKEAAYARVLASEQGRRGILVTLVGDVASTYFLLRQLDLQLDIARRTLAVNDQTVTLFQDRLTGGLANRLEVDRILANRSVTAATIPDLEQRIAIAENALSLLLGRAPSPIPHTALGNEVLPPGIPPGLPASLLERRPDVVQAEELLVAANADVGAARALFFPTISLTGFLGAISGDLTTLLGGSGGVWSAGPSVLQPLFRGGRLRSNLEAAQASFDEAVAQYRRAALNAYREVANALITIQKLANTRVEQEAGVAALQDASNLARVRYDAGLASYLEILTSDQDLFQQQVLLAQTQGSELQARAELYRALGGGWQP